MLAQRVSEDRIYHDINDGQIPASEREVAQRSLFKRPLPVDSLFTVESSLMLSRRTHHDDRSRHIRWKPWLRFLRQVVAVRRDGSEERLGLERGQSEECAARGRLGWRRSWCDCSADRFARRAVEIFGRLEWAVDLAAQSGVDQPFWLPPMTLRLTRQTLPPTRTVASLDRGPPLYTPTASLLKRSAAGLTSRSCCAAHSLRFSSSSRVIFLPTQIKICQNAPSERRTKFQCGTRPGHSLRHPQLSDFSASKMIST